MATLTPKLTSTPSTPPTYNVGMAETFSWIPVEGAGRPLFARANYVTNFDDFAVSISAAELNISSIEIKDGNSGRVADVEDAGGGLNALRVLTQDLESTEDSVTIGDPSGNFATVNKSLSALRVLEVSPVTAVSITNQLTGLTVLNQITSINVLNTVAISGSVTILNPVSSVTLTNQISSFSITNPTTAVNILNTVAVSGEVTVLNPISSVSITNQLTGITILNPTTDVNVLNTVAVSGSLSVINSVSSVSITNQLTSITVSNPITAVNILNTVAVSGFVTVNNPISSVSLTNQISAFTVLNPITAVDVLNTVAISGSVTVNNPITAVTVTNQITSVEVTGSVTVNNPVTSVEILNPIALKDLNNHNVTVTSATSSLNVNVTNHIPVSFAAGSTNTDAFGRLRTSNPLTLFDSSHRYKDNGLWVSLTAVDGSVSFNQNQGLVDLTVSNLSGSSVIRETTKVFSYQAGKSLLVMNTFVMAPSAENLRQRVGYYGQDNGIYFQLDGGILSFVERSLVNGSPSSETITPQTSWNGDKLDGTGPSGLTLDVTKAQIQWMDVEWLGVGTIRTGFIINGQFIVCHSFHHANLIASTYITTASLPLRYEITNKGATDGSSTLKQICSTVISEGGYELRGSQQAISIPVTAPRTFAATNTYYPIISIRLKSTPDRLDAIVILTALSILGTGNGINYNWQLKSSGTTSGGSWISAGDDSAVEYNITGASFTGGRVLASGYLNASNQGSPNLDVLKEALFKFQLERNNLLKTPFEITLVAATDTVNGSGMFASLDWEEISR